MSIYTLLSALPLLPFFVSTNYFHCNALQFSFPPICNLSLLFSLALRPTNSATQLRFIFLLLQICCFVLFKVFIACSLAIRSLQMLLCSRIVLVLLHNNGSFLNYAPFYYRSDSIPLISLVILFVVALPLPLYMLVYLAPMLCGLDAGNPTLSIVIFLLLPTPPTFFPFPDSCSLRLAPQYLLLLLRTCVLTHIRSRHTFTDIEDWASPLSASSARLHFGPPTVVQVPS